VQLLNLLLKVRVEVTESLNCIRKIRNLVLFRRADAKNLHVESRNSINRKYSRVVVNRLNEHYKLSVNK
jgi:hypothetical protein